MKVSTEFEYDGFLLRASATYIPGCSYGDPKGELVDFTLWIKSFPEHRFAELLNRTTQKEFDIVATEKLFRIARGDEVE